MLPIWTPNPRTNRKPEVRKGAILLGWKRGKACCIRVQRSFNDAEDAEKSLDIAIRAVFSDADDLIDAYYTHPLGMERFPREVNEAAKEFVEGEGLTFPKVWRVQR